MSLNDGDVAVPYQLPAGAPVSSRVLLARLAANLTSEEVAAALGITLRSYQRSERGIRKFTRAELIVISMLTNQALGFFEVLQ